VKNHFDKFSARGAVFGVSHTIRLLSLPKVDGEKGRKQVQKRLFAAGWSVAELDAEIRRLYGRRRQGGRQKRVGGGGELLGQLEEFCETWRRWYARINPGEGEADQPINKLPAGVRDAVTRAARVIAKLQETVTTAASTASPEASVP